jgi:hypothetical protein
MPTPVLRFTASPPPPPPPLPSWPAPPGSQFPGGSGPQWSAPSPSFYPITIGRGVSLSFHMFRFGWRTFVAINLLAYLPIALLSALSAYATYTPMYDWQQSLLTNGVGSYSNQSQLLTTFPWWAFALTVVTGFLVGPFATIGQAALVDAVATALRGGRLSARGSLAAAIARLPSLIAIYLVLSAISIAAASLGLALPLLGLLPSLGITGGPLVFVGLIIFVAVLAAVIFATIRFTFALMALIAERLSAGQALRRSWHLLAGSMLRLIGWAIVFALILGLISVVVTFAGLFIGLIASPPQPGSLGTLQSGSVIAETFATTLIEALFAPFLSIGLTLLYFEIRWRHGEAVSAPGQPAPSAPGS